MVYKILSVVTRVYKPAEVYNYDLDIILSWIREGVCPWGDLKDITSRTQMATTGEELQQLKKNNLPMALFNGVFSYKASGFLTQYSNFTALDFDHFVSEEELCHIGRRLVITPCVYAVFRTPSGKGLKAIVMHDNDNPDYHEELYDQLLAKFHIAATDSSVRDLARGQYLCYDPFIWVNNNCQPFHFTHDTTYYPRIRSAQGNSSTLNIDDIYSMLSPVVVLGGKSDQSIIAILNAHWKKIPDRWIVGNRANSVFASASELCKAGVNIDLALGYLKKEYMAIGLGEDEIQYQALRGYQCNAESYGINRSKFNGYGRKGD